MPLRAREYICHWNLTSIRWCIGFSHLFVHVFMIFVLHRGELNAAEFNQKLYYIFKFLITPLINCNFLLVYRKLLFSHSLWRSFSCYFRFSMFLWIHISNLTKSSFYHLYNISQLCFYLSSSNTLAKLILLLPPG